MYERRNFGTEPASYKGLTDFFASKFLKKCHSVDGINRFFHFSKDT